MRLVKSVSYIESVRTGSSNPSPSAMKSLRFTVCDNDSMHSRTFPPYTQLFLADRNWRSFSERACYSHFVANSLIRISAVPIRGRVVVDTIPIRGVLQNHRLRMLRLTLGCGHAATNKIRVIVTGFDYVGKLYRPRWRHYPICPPLHYRVACPIPSKNRI